MFNKLLKPKNKPKVNNVELTDDQVSLLYEMLCNARIGGGLLEIAYETKIALKKYYKPPNQLIVSDTPQPQ